MEQDLWSHRLLIAFVGLILSALLPMPQRGWGAALHPVALLGKLITSLELRLNRQDISPRYQQLNGLITVILSLLIAIAVGAIIIWSRQYSLINFMLECVVVAVLLAVGGLYRFVIHVAKALQENGLEAGREAVSHIVGRDTLRLDSCGVARAAIESLAENSSDAVVAPLFWFLALDIPGLTVYKTINTLDSMIGHLSPRYRSFGMIAAKIDDAANFIPARLTGFLLVIAAIFTPTAQAKLALHVMYKDASHHSSPNSGWPEAAMAGALGLALAGPRHYAGHKTNDLWIGEEGSHIAGPVEIRRALMIYVVAMTMLATLLLFGVLYLLVPD